MAFIPGAPDYQLQNAPSTNLIGEFSYDSTADPQTFDLTALILPHHQGLAFQFVQLTGAAGQFISIQTNIGGVFANLIPLATLSNNQQAIRQLLGASVVQGTASTLSITTQRVGGAGAVTGLVRVFGLTYLPVQSEWNQPGQVMGASSATNVIVAAGATASLVGFPPSGFLYKVKSLTCRSNAAHAAGASMAFTGTLFGYILARFATTAVNVESYTFYPDLWLSDGISFVNGSAGEFRADCYCEAWPLT